MANWVECQLCPKYCRIAPGRSGDCRVRVNVDGRLISTVYGKPCAVHVDPIEKKPLFHFLPGTPIFSIATAGCNLHCKNCQNWSISQANPEDVEVYDMPPEKVVKLAKEAGTPSIAYTYTEPNVFYEYTLDTCKLAREHGIRNVLVTAGFINAKPLKELLKYVDAANVDLKFFDNRLYQEICEGALRPVLRALEIYKDMGVWLEITNLVIPTLNDDMKKIEKMCKWIVKKLGDDVPLHFSRFFPRYKLRNLPPTPLETLEKARQVALDVGLKYVYIGNIRSKEGENTYCPNPNCPDKDKPLIERVGYRIIVNRIENGRCPSCGTKIAGVWK